MRAHAFFEERSSDLDATIPVHGPSLSGLPTAGSFLPEYSEALEQIQGVWLWVVMYAHMVDVHLCPVPCALCARPCLRALLQGLSVSVFMHAGVLFLFVRGPDALPRLCGVQPA